MTTDEFADLLSAAVAAILPVAELHIEQRRDVVLEARILLGEATFIQVYFNALTGRKSYVLIHEEERVMGYDNYRFWHYHPVHDPAKHVPCNEPDLSDVLLELKTRVDEELWEQDPVVLAEIQEARAAYQAGGYVTIDEYVAQQREKATGDQLPSADTDLGG
jgi:hypothetical protein